MRKSFIKQNNTGFTLVELIVAVVVLAIAAAPLLYNFVVAARVDKKSRDLAASTLAAQSIQETITATSIDGIKSLSKLGTATVTTETDKDGKITSKIANYSCNGKDFDALVTLDTDTYSDFNAEAIPVVSVMDAAFNQVNGVAGDSDLIVLSGRDKNEIKSRTITIDIDNINTSTSSKTVIGGAKLTYTYELRDGSKIPYEYDLAPEGVTLSAAKTEMNVYLMFDLWTPDLWDTTNTDDPKKLTGGKSSTASETIIINNPDDIPVNLVLVSQSGEVKNNLTIKQYQSKKYDTKNPTCFTFCNAAVKSYKVFSGAVLYVDKTKSLEKTAVITNNDAVIYNVKIELFEAGSDFSGKALYTMNATR